MREIPLKNGGVALVDDQDWAAVSVHKWVGYQSNRSKKTYALCFTSEKGKTIAHYMHRDILGLQYGDERQGEHRSENGLDNRRSNLRLATDAQNKWNRGPHCSNKLGIKGVYRHPCGKYRASIQCNKKRHSLGLFETLEEAVQAYQVAAQSLHGEFARTA
jgi:hypothetical protein